MMRQGIVLVGCMDVFLFVVIVGDKFVDSVETLVGCGFGNVYSLGEHGKSCVVRSVVVGCCVPSNGWFAKGKKSIGGH
jgi:hypothetical protein